jgi:DJ-1 family protein
MAHVLIVLAPGAEEIEAITVADVLVRANQEVLIASTTDIPVVRGSRGIALTAHTLLSTVLDRTFDLIYLPGGYGSAEICRDDVRVQNVIQSQLSAGRPLAVICASAIALVPRGLARTLSLTCYPGVRAQVEPHVGRWLDQAVVVDGNLHTSQGPGTAMAFAVHLARLLAGSEIALKVAKDMITDAPM